LKRTLQLFQLLIVVFGLYAALKYAGPAKNIVALSSIIVVILLDRMESFFDRANADLLAREKARQPAADQKGQAEKNLEILRHGKNNLMVADAVQALLRDLGLAVTPCGEYPMLDRIVKVEEQTMHMAMKVVGDLDDLTREWEHLDPADGFIKGEGGQLRLLLIVNAAATHSQSGDQEFDKIPNQTGKFLAARHTVAITTQTVAQIYRLCKEMHQNPKRVFGRIYHHPGGLFQL